jgi:hypothetical protein
MKRTGRAGCLLLLAALSPAACQSSSGELQGLAQLAPLDCAVLVTGGAFLAPDPSQPGTFAARAPGGAAAAADEEPIPIDAVVDVLQRGAVFQRTALDTDPARRRAVRDQLREGRADPEALRFLQEAREQGFDFLLVVEELQDGPIDIQGTNSRWPITFLTWILLGFGALIPDQTFESRATLRVTLRELQTGRILHDPLLAGGPIELALFERTDFVGLLPSIIVPPFWVGDDEGQVSDAVREITQRRLLLSLARDLKSESVRQRLRERSAARLLLIEGDGGPRVAADSAEDLSVAGLRGEPPPAAGASQAFEQELLASRRWDGERFRYEARLPPGPAGRSVQVLVGTISGSVASATFRTGEGP